MEKKLFVTLLWSLAVVGLGVNHHQHGMEPTASQQSSEKIVPHRVAGINSDLAMGMQKHHLQELFHRYGENNSLTIEGFRKLLQNIGIAPVKRVHLNHGHHHHGHGTLNKNIQKVVCPTLESGGTEQNSRSSQVTGPRRLENVENSRIILIKTVSSEVTETTSVPVTEENHVLETPERGKMRSLPTVLNGTSAPNTTESSNANWLAKGRANESTTMSEPETGSVMYSKSTNQNPHQCFNTSNLLQSHGIGMQVILNATEFSYLCPAIINQIDGRSCAVHVNSEKVESPPKTYSMQIAWIGGFIAISIISFLSLLGVILVPLMNRVFFKFLLSFLVALAVGTLSGDAFLHLLPHSHASYHHSHEKPLFDQNKGSLFRHLIFPNTDKGPYLDSTWKGLTALGGLYFMFLVEHLITLIKQFKDKKKKNQKKPENDEDPEIKKQLSKYDSQLSPNEEKLDAEDRQEGYLRPEAQDSSHFDSPQPAVLEEEEVMIAHCHPQEVYNEYVLRGCKNKCHSHFHDTLGQSDDLIHHHHDYHHILHHHHHQNHHPHSHSQRYSREELQDAGIATLAWMVIMGDGLHNFSDGLAIGAAFTEGLSSGLSTSVAVFCHELPHELGDFAVLLKAGMTVKQAVLYNALSAMLAYLGMATGILVGHYAENVSMWIFALTAGLFMYVALVDMITTLINHKDKPKRSDKTLQAIQQMGQAVNFAVGKFVAVGEAIANENQDLKEEIHIACIEAKRAGETIAGLTDVAHMDRPESDARITIFTDKTGVVKAARLLLSSVTKVLLLADRIVIKQIIASRNKVIATLEQLEKVSSFQEFVQIFSQFGNEMVEFAHLTGDRQNDLKDEKKKARMAAARAVLEKCTMMLLTASKTCLRHPDCESARINKKGVFHRMRVALEQVIDIVTDCRPNAEAEVSPNSIYTGIKAFKSKIEALRENLYFLPKQNLSTLLDFIVEQTEDFTDSAYISHDQRERILELTNLAKMELGELVSVWMHVKNQKSKNTTEDLELAILKISQCMNELKREIHSAATLLATDLLKYHADHVVLKALKISGVEGNLEAVAGYTCKLSEQKEQLVEACQLLRHVSGTEPLEITCIHAEDTFRVTGPQIISAAETLTLHPSSKIAKENLDVFCEAWESQITDMSVLLREINDVFEGRRGEKRACLSLPRPGKHNANLKSLKPVKLDSEEQAKIAKLGLELRLLTSAVDCEAEKWEDQETEIIVRHGQSLSNMAYSMYLFSRGEGLLKSTQDLINQAEVFASEGLKLASSLHALSNQLEDDGKPFLLLEVNKLVPTCQQLQLIAKAPVQGKTTSFTKVEKCFLNTKDLMAALAHIFPLCSKFLRKCKAGSGCLISPQLWKENRWQAVTDEEMNGKTLDVFEIKSLEHHVAKLTFLESK
uniref:Alpha-catulin n=2 Tax=Ornithorhynchus anatinus TaxID=9258 RepID=A0A6I8P565_ORNAN